MRVLNKEDVGVSFLFFYNRDIIDKIQIFISETYPSSKIYSIKTDQWEFESFEEFDRYITDNKVVSITRWEVTAIQGATVFNFGITGSKFFYAISSPENLLLNSFVPTTKNYFRLFDFSTVMYTAAFILGIVASMAFSFFGLFKTPQLDTPYSEIFELTAGLATLFFLFFLIKNLLDSRSISLTIDKSWNFHKEKLWNLTYAISGGAIVYLIQKYL
jgi:hypothetical protein